ncbi:MAG: Sjogren's syndrome/scleroderma autoantigen 1 family protein [Haloarculaceae archaeon]
MSDFDREAEREKLREQFAEDERKREATERMSELLLQGATMTNKHCDTCGDPIFRYDGQEFCPSCQGGQVAEQADQSADAGAAGQSDAAAAEQAAAAESQPVDQAAQSQSQSQSQSQPQSQSSTPAADQAGVAGESAPGQDGAGRPDERVAPVQRQSPSGSRAEDVRATSAPGDLDEAAGALNRTLTRLARQAEASDDLGRTREYLAAAEEAAEALAAVKRASR